MRNTSKCHTIFQSLAQVTYQRKLHDRWLSSLVKKYAMRWLNKVRARKLILEGINNTEHRSHWIGRLGKEDPVVTAHNQVADMELGSKTINTPNHNYQYLSISIVS
jgi:hypothetical protein